LPYSTYNKVYIICRARGRVEVVRRRRLSLALKMSTEGKRAKVLLRISLLSFRLFLDG
jgi:hypothetical protein